MGEMAITTKTIYSNTELLNGLKFESNGLIKRTLQNEFYRRFKNHVYKNAINNCRNFDNGQQLAIELVQTVFITAFDKISKFSFPDDIPEKDHHYYIKAWLGQIGFNIFKRFYGKQIKEISLDDEECSIVEPSYDPFDELVNGETVEVPNELRVKLQIALSQLTDRQKHILLVYAGEGCIDSKKRLGDSALEQLCKLYDTTPENIRQIKKRSLDKIRGICFSENN